MDWFKRTIMGNESSGPSDSISDYSLSTSGGLSDFLAPFTGGSSGSGREQRGGAPAADIGGSTSNIPAAAGPAKPGGAAKLPVSASAPSGGFTLGGSRGGSRTTSAQSTPLEAPEVDLSHLSEEERAQIADVMARARELQDEDTQRIRSVSN